MAEQCPPGWCSWRLCGWKAIDVGSCSVDLLYFFQWPQVPMEETLPTVKTEVWEWPGRGHQLG